MTRRLTLTALCLVLLTAADRAARWPAVRAGHLRAEPWCRVCGCGDTRFLEVHHVTPFAVDPALELEPTNLVTLCRQSGRGCHWYAGHLGLSWKTNNAEIVSIYGGVSNSTGRAVWRMRTRQ